MEYQAPKVVELEEGGTEVKQKAEIEVLSVVLDIPTQQGNEFLVQVRSYTN